jgi:hypothetical protein
MTRTNAAVAEMNAITAIYVNRVGPIEELYDAAAVTCLPGSWHGTRAKVVDDQNILFYTAAEGFFWNTLRQKCPTLQLEYVSSWLPGSFFAGGGAVRKLCQWDSFNLVSGVTCRLGRFVSVTETQAAELLARDPRELRDEELDSAKSEESPDAREADEPE